VASFSLQLDQTTCLTSSTIWPGRSFVRLEGGGLCCELFLKFISGGNAFASLKALWH
jgi:hypothetical protein